MASTGNKKPSPAGTLAPMSRGAISPRPVLVCPDKFRGSFSATEVGGIVTEALARQGIPADGCAIADGGEGTLAVVKDAVSHEIVMVDTCDAHGRALSAPVAMLRNGRQALIESAAIIGHAPVCDAAVDAWGATSRGIGLAIAQAAQLGAAEVLLAIGGTVSTDGGAGAIEALDESGWPRPGTGKRQASRGGRRRLTPKLVILCDGRVSWAQAATMFAPQKGADPPTVQRLLKRLDDFAVSLPYDPRTQVMAGAGGGLAGGLWSAASGELRSGAGWLLDLLDFTPRMLAARAVITGEGRLDRQTLLGKAVGEVATRARQAGVPCHAIVGSNASTEFDARILDFESVHEAADAAAIRAATDAIVPQLATR